MNNQTHYNIGESSNQPIENVDNINKYKNKNSNNSGINSGNSGAELKTKIQKNKKELNKNNNTGRKKRKDDFFERYDFEIFDENLEESQIKNENHLEEKINYNIEQIDEESEDGNLNSYQKGNYKGQNCDNSLVGNDNKIKGGYNYVNGYYGNELYKEEYEKKYKMPRFGERINNNYNIKTDNANYNALFQEDMLLKNKIINLKKIIKFSKIL